jgi:hypothetical protein
MPGQPARSRASDFPRQFTLENHRSAAGFTACIVRLCSKSPTFSVNPLCRTLLRPAIQKDFHVVQKLWTLVLPCGTLRKRGAAILLSRAAPLF